MTKEDFLLEVNHIIDSGHNDIRLGNLYDTLMAGIAKSNRTKCEELMMRVQFTSANEGAIYEIKRIW